LVVAVMSWPDQPDRDPSQRKLVITTNSLNPLPANGSVLVEDATQQRPRLQRHAAAEGGSPLVERARHDPTFADPQGSDYAAVGCCVHRLG
jgi:hypothetical protein